MPEVVQVPSIPAEDWNALMERLTRARPLRIVELPDRLRPHPWQITVRFRSQRSEDRGQWEFRVEPGYVNGDEVEVSIPNSEFPLPISSEPWIPIPMNRWRAVGTDAIGDAETVPTFFRARGVQAPETVRFNFDEFGARQLIPSSARSAPLSPEPRLLRAIDVVLVKPRPRLITDWQIGSPISADQVTLLISYAPPSQQRAFVELQTGPYRPADPLALSELVLGDANDLGRDERLIGTIYLLSPPGAQPDSEPDSAAWQPFVKHNLFWNLNHATRQPVNLDQSTRYPVPGHLAFGVAADTIAGLAASVNDPQNLVAQLVDQSRVEGKFWSV